MLRIECPHCGPRDHTEFLYGGDASRPRPDTADVDDATWTRYLYLRTDPVGEHLEYWHHVYGCRSWLKVRRNTVTQEIEDVRPAREARR